MGRFFSQDSPFMRGLWWFTDIVIINVYFLLTCLPVITIGAALSAAYDAARKSQESRGNVSRNYFKAFTSNFVQATIIWLPLAALGAGLVYAWIGFQVPLLLPFKAVLTFVYLMCFWWVFPLQSRFSNPMGRTISNSFIFGFSHLPTTLLIAVIDGLCLFLAYASYVYWIQSLFLLMVMGPGMMIALHVPLIEQALKSYTQAEPSKQKELSKQKETAVPTEACVQGEEK